MSIFDRILADKEKSVVAELSSEKPVINTEEFFAQYCSKEEFSQLLNKCNENDLRGLDYLLNLMNDDKSFEVTPYEKFDANKNLFVWVSIKGAKTSSGFKVLTAGKMCQLVGIYGLGVLDVKLKLDDLYQELRS